jgi:hypothetical protein
MLARPGICGKLHGFGGAIVKALQIYNYNRQKGGSPKQPCIKFVVIEEIEWHPLNLLL